MNLDWVLSEDSEKRARRKCQLCPFKAQDPAWVDTPLRMAGMNVVHLMPGVSGDRSGGANVFSLRSTCGESFDSALHSIAVAIGFHRIDGVVVGCPRLETIHTHSENGIGMTGV